MTLSEIAPANILRVHCVALGFLAVILKDVPADHQALRATAIADLIESFCRATVPHAFSSPHVMPDETNGLSELDRAIDQFKLQLHEKGEAHLPEDRKTLLKFYERLHQRQARRKERHFYATGSDNLIANRILRMIDEEIELESEGK